MYQLVVQSQEESKCDFASKMDAYLALSPMDSIPAVSPQSFG